MPCLAFAVSYMFLDSGLAIDKNEAYVEKATVVEATRLDWLYPVLEYSPVKAPRRWRVWIAFGSVAMPGIGSA